MTTATRVGDIAQRDVVTVRPDDEITWVVNLLIERDISGVPVTDPAGTLVGILTERDCIAVALTASYHAEPGGRVAEFMSTPVESAAAGESLVEVAERFCRSRFRRFPVIDAAGQLIGLVTRRDVLAAMLQRGWF